MSSNLPPGVNEGMIPGNRAEDDAWEKLHEQIDEDCKKLGLCDIDAWVAWQIGVRIYRTFFDYDARFDHRDGGDI